MYIIQTYDMFTTTNQDNVFKNQDVKAKQCHWQEGVNAVR